MSIVELTVDRFLTADRKFAVKFHVTRAVGIPAELFLHRTDTGEYVCVGAPTDLLSRPKARDTAQAAFEEFYLSDTVVYTDELKRKAENFEAGMRVTLDRAIADWDADDHRSWASTELLVLNTD